MRKLIASITVIVSVCVLSACGTSQKQTPYEGADLVGQINSALMIGTWKVSVINPAGEENKLKMTQSFKQDGTWESTVIPSEEQTAQFGPIEYKGYGNWQVEGDVIVSKLNKLEETTGNTLGGIMRGIVSVFIPKSSTVNVYEQSKSRMIFVHDRNKQATLLERI